MGAVWRWIRKRRGELALALVALMVSLIGAELAGRWHLARRRGLPLLHDAEERFYPRLHHGLRDYAPEAVNILLLGGSVLERIRVDRWSRRHPEWRFYNVSVKAHTSLDSQYKLEYLLREGRRFDYVIFYHGINEVRANNVPPELFAADYSHYAFYRMAHTIFRDRATMGSLLVRNSYLAYSIELARCLSTDQAKLLPPDAPPKKWKPFGAEIKTAESFRGNLVRIANLAAAAGATLVVPRFAYHYPPGYSIAAWRDRTLGYHCDNPGDPTHIWGLPANVAAGIDVHNRVIDEERHRFVFVDTSELMGRLESFCDICHFSPDGTRAFVNLIVRRLEGLEQERSRQDQGVREPAPLVGQ